MQQFLHLLIVDAARDLALATWHGARWVLPMFSAPERMRVGSPVLRWLQDRGVEGRLLGQWLGRLESNPTALDWLVVVRASRVAFAEQACGWRWTPPGQLSPSAALMDYQRWAVERVLQPGALPAVPGPFGTVTWLDDVQAWIGEALGTPIDSTVIVPHRVTSHEVVLECQASGSRAFFKGLWQGRASEAAITADLARLLPGSFAETRALEIRADGSVWWLMNACPGVTLADAYADTGAVGAVVAYARVQQRIGVEVAGGRSYGMPRLELSSLASWTRSLLEDCRNPTDVSLQVVDDLCEVVASIDMPMSWVAADLDPTNLMVDGSRVRFIDLDDAVLGQPPLAVGILGRRLQRRPGTQRTEATWPAQLYRAYELAWALPPMGQVRWSAFEVVSQLLECQMAWQRVEGKTARGEIYGASDAARAVLRRDAQLAVHHAVASLRPT